MTQQAAEIIEPPCAECGMSAADYRETLDTLLALLNPLHGSLDRQTYDERVQENFDAPRDREYSVEVTAQMERDLTQAICIIENRLRTKSP